MKNTFILILLTIVYSCSSPTSKKPETKSLKANEEKLQVLLIGTFHFANFNAERNLDITQTDQVDVLNAQNQEELEKITTKIAEFKPNKIFVEYPFSKQVKLDSMVTNLNPSDFTKLKRNEIVQLAYRAAHKLNHSKLYAFDYLDADFPYDEMMKTIKQANQTDAILENERELAAYEKRYNQIVSDSHSVTELLLFLNQEENYRDDLGWYLNFANQAGTLYDTTGTYLTSEWYRRNLRMYSILQKQIEKQDRRIMVLAGASHISLLKHFMEYNLENEIIEFKEVMEMVN